MAAGEEGCAHWMPAASRSSTRDLADFAAALRSDNHTLKRALTDPRLLAGSAMHTRTRSCTARGSRRIVADAENDDGRVGRLYRDAVTFCRNGSAGLRTEADGGFPEKVTAFREGMAVHGRYGQPCPRCGAKVQRIRYAANETNYCPTCQTGGQAAGRPGLSRLLGSDWPRTLDELEALRKK